MYKYMLITRKKISVSAKEKTVRKREDGRDGITNFRITNDCIIMFIINRLYFVCCNFEILSLGKNLRSR